MPKGVYNHHPWQAKNLGRWMEKDRSPKLLLFKWSKRELAYLLGEIKGDGWIIWDQKRNAYGVALGSKEKKFADSFFQVVKDLGLHPKIYRHKDGMYRVRAYSKKLARWVQKIGLKEFLSGRQAKIAFLRGFYESEGSFSRNNHGKYEKWMLSISNTDRELLGLARECLLELNLNFASYLAHKARNEFQKDVWQIATSNKGKIRNFLDLIRPCIKGDDLVEN